MNQKQKTVLKRIVAAAIVYIAAAAAKKMNVFAGMPQPWTELVVFLIPYLIIGWDIVYKAFRGIKNGQVFDENFLMTVATFGAFGVGEFSEAVAVMLSDRGVIPELCGQPFAPVDQRSHEYLPGICQY